MEFILERQAATEAILERLAARVDRHDQQIAAINATLRRAIRLSVEEQRRERVRRQQLDEKITQIAAAQLENEEATKELKKEMQRFLDWWRHGGSNGHSPI